MEIKKNAILVVVLLMILTSFTFAEEKTTQVTRLNTNPLMRVSSSGIKSIDQFKELVEKNADRIREGFEKTDEASIYPDFMEQVRSGNIEERILPKGQRFKWMLFYPQKRIKVVHDVEWAGKTTVNAYVVTVAREQECKRYQFFIPRVCGNICFVESFGGDAVCNIAITPREVQAGESFTVDMSGSKCAASYDITVSREGQQVDSKNLKGEENRWQKSFKDPGVYEFTAQALNNEGVASRNECRASLTVKPAAAPEPEPEPTPPPKSEPPRTGMRKLFIIAEAGPMIAKGTYTGFIFARVGLEYFFIPEKFCIIGSGGYAFNLGSSQFKSHFLSDIILTVHFKKLFIGGGIGFSGKVRNAVLEDGVLRPEWKSDIDIVGNLGYEIFTISHIKSALFGEIRIPIDDELEFSKDHALLLGIRFMF